MFVEGQFQGKGDLINGLSDMEGTIEMGSNQGQTLPVFQKIEFMSEKVQRMRKEHTLMCNEVKSLTADFLLGSEACAILQNLSIEHEGLKKKYHEECEILKKKYLEECSERKRLYNEVIELKGNIRVFCRCRPLKADEVETGSTSVIDFDSSNENELQIVCSDSTGKQFKFDHVFKPEDSQEAVFVQTMPIVTSILDGYNVCILAYGQTGTGKTYTMEGTPDNKGVNYRTLEELFRASNERKSIIAYEFLVSMLEIYNETIRDLLFDKSSQHAQKLEIKQSTAGTHEVPGLVEARVYNTEEVWELLKSGSRVRSVGSTNANELSSRSHCLLRVTVVAQNLVNGQRTRSHLWLVDLAGSERVGRIQVEGDRLKESQFINRSLSALGDVISALASKASHIPFRNSKLTHLLQSSLGGDCKTLMFVQISPNLADLGETLCSLNFASRVRGVKRGPACRQTDDAQILKYKQLVEKAKHNEKEMKKLEESLHYLQLKLVARDHVCRSLQHKVEDLENQLAEERKIRLKQECRALASVPYRSSSLPPLNQARKPAMERKPPLAPTKLRSPLRRITNIMPLPSHIPLQKRGNLFVQAVDKDKGSIQLAPTKLRLPLQRSTNFTPHPSPVPPQKRGKFFPQAMDNDKGGTQSSPTKLRLPLQRATNFMPQPSPVPLQRTWKFFPQALDKDKENTPRMSTLGAKAKTFLIPRRGSIVARPPLKTNQILQPKRRRASIASLLLESNSKLKTPLQGSAAQLSKNRGVRQQSFVWDPQRVSYTTTRMYSPMQLRQLSSYTVEATPVVPSSSKFSGSYPSQAGSWKPKHPTVVALQKKVLQWSPVNLRGSMNLKGGQNSLLST